MEGRKGWKKKDGGKEPGEGGLGGDRRKEERTWKGGEQEERVAMTRKRRRKQQGGERDKEDESRCDKGNHERSNKTDKRGSGVNEVEGGQRERGVIKVSRSFPSSAVLSL